MLTSALSECGGNVDKIFLFFSWNVFFHESVDKLGFKMVRFVVCIRSLSEARNAFFTCEMTRYSGTIRIGSKALRTNPYSAPSCHFVVTFCSAFRKSVGMLRTFPELSPSVSDSFEFSVFIHILAHFRASDSILPFSLTTSPLQNS